ncbi:flippase [Pseudomonas sp. S5F11]|uniref:flippase n=1 Tax=Pseudomonas sp. S5F11 TaxID=2866385 RepID=UPI001C7D98D6|nr:flippase [Pseudomonas sp. S5F11]MBX4135802.1 flippase [Pseudomonas sp. S5F11]
MSHIYLKLVAKALAVWEGKMRLELNVRNDTIYNLLGNIVPILAALIFIPYLTRELGAERFGFMTIMWALIGYFGIFDLGVSRALTYFATRSNDPVSPDPLAPAVKAGMQVVGVAGLIGMLLVMAASDLTVRKLLGNNLDMYNEALWALWITALIIPLTAMGNGLRGVLEGLGDFKDVAVIKSVTGSVFFIAPACLAFYNVHSLYAIAVSFFMVRLVTSFWCWYAVQRSWQYDSSREKAVFPTHRKALLSYGAWALLSSIISPLMMYGDRFIISTVLGAQMVGMYAVLQEMMGRTVLFSASFASALLPRFAKENGETLKSNYRRYNTLSTVVMIVFYTMFWVFSKFMAELWLGRNLDEYKNIFALFSFALFMNSIAQLPFFFLHSKGMPEVPAKFHLVEFILYVPACIWATLSYGVEGAAVVWVFRVLIDWVLLQWAVRKILG